MKSEVKSVGFVRRCCIFVSVSLMLLMISSGVAVSKEGGWTGNVNLFLGGKGLNEDHWTPAEAQGEGGIQIDFRPRSWPVSLVIDLLGAGGKPEGSEFESRTSELNIGVRKIWEQFTYVRPFIGGGVSFVHGEMKGKMVDGVVEVGSSDEDDGAGLWFGGGVYWTLAKHFNIGLEAKLSAAEVTLFGIEANAGGGHFGMLVGGHW